MNQSEFVIEEADEATVLVRHRVAGVRFLFVIKSRRFSDLGNDDQPKESDLSLRTQARRFALQQARAQGWID